MIVLTRFAHFETGVLGRMVFPSGLQLYTVERPWLNNQSFVSCIPAGDYGLEWDTTGRIRDVPRLRNTTPRTQINIHIANRPTELHGCIAPGMDWGMEGRSPMVSRSKAAMKLVREQLKPMKPNDGSSMVLEGQTWPAQIQIRDYKSE